MTLEEFLETNIRYVETHAPQVPSGQDLPPILAYIKPAGEVIVVGDLGKVWHGSIKDIAMTVIRGRLREERATMYALISAAWVVGRNNPEEGLEVERIVAQEGTGGRYRDERKECYLVSVGDRERCLVDTLLVKRDYKGKIRQLIRSKTSSGIFRGRMANLLEDD